MGRLWLFEETINTDVLAPGFYMKSPIDELSKHCLEAIRPEFASNVRKGDVILAGENMGVGSSREQAAEVLKFLGVSCIIAKSFAGIFYRNAINLGLPVFTLPSEPSLPKQFVDGSFVNFDFDSTTLNLEQPSLQVKLDPLPKFLRELITDGGLVSHLEKRFSEK
ncbi:MAG: 3-isopropylmalate dehydratase [Paracoccaceae bacterium]|jgi:3-isopropylmalate/(R)-2-methylmalate dehydratase small subunit|nr:MAG: 3-isopropylmalate dehydratase small subunit 1 [Rhodobacterales bacterium]|tara:strand:- start:82 stop:576 length:495 start_codon:yes stop_codon:yes gene_type:complete